MDSGDTYFKLYRKIFENGLWVNPVAFRMFIWLLGNAVYSEKGVELGTLAVNRGEYLRSYRKLQDDLSFIDNKQRKSHSLSTLHRASDLLNKLGIISKRETELGTLYTIINYDKYQPLRNNFLQSAKDAFTENLEPGTPLGTTSEQQANNTKKVKKVKRIYSPNSIEFRLASLLFDLIRERHPQHKKPDFQKWSKHIDLMIRKDGREPAQIEKVIIWAQKHPVQHNGFTWANITLSTENLREKFDQLSLQMRGNGSSGNNTIQPIHTITQFNISQKITKN